MAETVINGKDGTADFTINYVSYKTVLDMFRVREIIEMTVADVFAIEGVSDQEPGRSHIEFEIAGLGKKGASWDGPLIPAPQGVNVKMTFSSGCFLVINANFTEMTGDRLVNTNMRISGRGLSKGVYTLTWVTM